MFKRIQIAGFLLLLIFPALLAGQTSQAEDLARRMDELYRAESSRALVEMEIVTPHWSRTLKMETWSEGMDKTLIRILEPKKEEGMATLRIGNEMWNYLPNTNKVMKIPPSMMMGSWMGSDFTNDDLVKEFSFIESYTFEMTSIEDSAAGPADLILGRQAVVWGSARVINPTDVIAPFAFNELDQEERRGVDAFRIRLPLGMMDEMDVGFVAGRGFKGENSAFFIRGKTYQLQTDMSALAVGFRRHLLLGLDITRAVGGAGVWIEAAHVLTDFFREEKRPGEKDYTRFSAGLDYNFRFGLYGFLEYHFNSAVDTLMLRSEFGAYPDMAYTSFRVYF